MSVTIPHMPFRLGWLIGTSSCCSGGGRPTNTYRNASNRVLKNCTEATGLQEISFKSATSLMASSKGGASALNVGLQDSMLARKPLSVAGNDEFEIVGVASLTAKQ